MQDRKNLIPRNEHFTCESCGALVEPAQGTSRNHCPHCLASKHVDLNVPGDRLNTCQGLMPTVNYEGTDPDRLRLLQSCVKCGKKNKNKIAPDDNKEVLFTLTDR